MQADSSVGRAPLLHGGCRRFEPCSAYCLRGRSSVWLERPPVTRKVAGSNPVDPVFFIGNNNHDIRFLSHTGKYRRCGIYRLLLAHYYPCLIELGESRSIQFRRKLLIQDNGARSWSTAECDSHRHKLRYRSVSINCHFCDLFSQVVDRTGIAETCNQATYIDQDRINCSIHHHIVV